MNNDKEWKGIKAHGGKTKFSRILEVIYQDEYNRKGMTRVDYVKSLFGPLNKKYRLRNKFAWNEKNLENNMKQKKVPKVKL